MHTISHITKDKKRFLGLLLLGDEQESMIDLYLERGSLYILWDEGRPIACCVVTEETSGVGEIKNIAVNPNYQRKGLGTELINFVSKKFRDTFHTLLVGTGEVPSSLNFYERCGFEHSHRIKGFFTTHYDHPIVEDGILLNDMVYLKKNLS